MKALTTSRFLIVAFLIIAPIILYAQGKQANNWYFGFHAGLNFNNGSPPQVQNGMTMNNASDGGGAAVISDEEGNLLFYSDGVTIWNRDHNTMFNADLIGSPTNQGAMIVPDPGNSNLYYFFNFTWTGIFNDFDFQYSVVDMTLDNGKGGVIPEQREILLQEHTSMHLSAVMHKNGTHVWVVVHELGNDTFYSYCVTENGIDAPVESNIGSDVLESLGYLKISPNGKKIALTHWGITDFCQVLDFDTQTGIISDQNIVTISRLSFGVEFSPDNSKLYTKWQGSEIFQYELNAGDAQAIIDSEVQLTPINHIQGALQLGPDGKIYCAKNAEFISVIHEPNKKAPDCNFEVNSLSLGPNAGNGEGFPSFIQTYLNEPEFTYTQHCFGQPTQFNIVNSNGIDAVEWKFNDPGNAPNDTSNLFSPTYTFSSADTFFVQLKVHSGFIERTIIDTVVIYAVPDPDFGNDTIFCPNDQISFTLDAGFGTLYNWNGNFNPGDSTFVVTDVGMYWVKVNDHGCIGRDTINVSRYTAATVDITNLDIKSSNCGQSNGAITGIVFIAPDPFTVSWLDPGGNQVGMGSDLLNVPSGGYTAEVNYGNNCTDQFGPYSIADINAPTIASALPEDDHCNQGIGRVTITPETGNITDYQYSINGIDYYPLTGDITGLSANTYNITLKDQFGCISGAVSVEVQNIDAPAVNCISTPETGSNGDGTITVISPGINLTYLLEGGSPQVSNVFTGLSASTYYVIVIDEFGCSTRDTVIVGNLQGSLLVALADNDRKCLYKPANSDIRIARVTGMKDLKATLYFNDNILNCTNFNANNSSFLGITAQLFSIPPRVELAWHGTTSITSTDTLSLGSMIFETLLQGAADVSWEPNSSVTYFMNESGDTIQPILIPGTIIIHELPVIAIDTDIVLCAKDSITLVPQITGGTDPFEFAWLTPNGASSSQEFDVLNAEPADAGNYLFSVSDNFRCADTVQVNLTVVPLPTANFPANNPTQDTIPFEQTYQLTATPGYASYEWNTGDTIYYVNVTQEGEYTVTMKTTEGCQSIESVYMLETFVPIQVPNAFTPNGDGLNDIFKPVVNTELVRQFRMSIYNKWGERIFETSDATEGWDGKNAMAGVYIWVISYANRVGKSEQMKGSVAIIK